MREKSHYFLLLGTLILAGCGQNPEAASTTLPQNNNTNNAAFDAQAKYYSLPTPDLTVLIGGYVGVSITQRQITNLFCRKTGAVIPNPTYGYKCWQAVSSGTQAQSTFNAIAAYSHYSLTIGNAVGGGALEESVNSDQSSLCRKTTPTYPGAISSYVCYQKL